MQSSKVAIVGIGKHTKRRKIELEPGTELALGKNRCLIDSLQHASLKYLSDQGWTITDNKTTDGVYVNQHKIKPETDCRLKNNDKFSLGPNTKGFEWRIQRILFRTPKNAEVEKDKMNTNSEAASSAKKVKTRVLERFTQEKDTLDPRMIEETTTLETEHLKSEKILHQQKIIANREKFEIKQNLENFEFERKLEEKMELERREFDKKYCEMACKIAENEVSMSSLQKEKDKMEEKLQKFEQLKEDLRQTSQKQKEKMEEKFKSEKELLQQELKAKREEFEARQKAENEGFKERLLKTKVISEQQRKELRELEQKMEQERKECDKNHSEMACKIVEKETSMTILQKEKDKMEEKLQNLEQTKEDLSQSLFKSQSDFETSMQQEKKERQKLTEELQKSEAKVIELNTQIQGIEDDKGKKLKMELLKNCKDELKCTICIELFITPITLNCGHIFCQFCINQFELEVTEKKDFKCPNCKILITSQTRCRQIENLIDAIYSEVDESFSKEREALIEERKKKIRKVTENFESEKIEKSPTLHNDWSIHSFLRNLT